MNNKGKNAVNLTLSSYLGMALKDLSGDLDAKRVKRRIDDKCCVCEEVDEGGVLPLWHCNHSIHINCAESIFKEAKNRCPTCNAVMLEGFEMAINPKYKPKQGGRARSGIPLQREASSGRDAASGKA
jgi:hypothetical protein